MAYVSGLTRAVGCEGGMGKWGDEVRVELWMDGEEGDAVCLVWVTRAELGKVETESCDDGAGKKQRTTLVLVLVWVKPTQLTRSISQIFCIPSFLHRPHFQL